jgi:hypothetical protein
MFENKTQWPLGVSIWRGELLLNSTKKKLIIIIFAISLFASIDQSMLYHFPELILKIL